MQDCPKDHALEKELGRVGVIIYIRNKRLCDARHGGREVISRPEHECGAVWLHYHRFRREGGVIVSRDNANNNGKKQQPGNNQDSEVAESKGKK